MMGGLVFMVPITLFVCITVIVLAAMAHRGRRAALPDARLDEIAQRLERMEQAIDAVALETERIAEAQRFTTKLLGERAPAGRSQ